MTKTKSTDAPKPRGWVRGDGRVWRRNGLPTWTARWHENGKGQQRDGFKTYEEAWAYIARNRTLARTGMAVDINPSMTVGQYATEVYLPALQALVDRGAMKATTVTGYRDTLRIYLAGSALGGMRLRDLTGQAVGHHLDRTREARKRNGQRVSEQTVAGHGKALSALLSHAWAEGALPQGNPFLRRDSTSATTVPKVQRAKAIRTTSADGAADWTKEDLLRFITAMETVQHGVGYMVAAVCGLRRGEVCGLRWDDLRPDPRGQQHRLSIVRAMTVADGKVIESTPKTESGRREVYLPPQAHAALVRWRSRQRTALFAAGVKVNGATPILTWVEQGRSRGGHDPSPLGSLVHPETFARGAQDACRKAGVPVVGQHGLRHVAATVMLKSVHDGGLGMDDVEVSRQLGHSDPRITRRVYEHVNPHTSVGAAARAWAAG